MLFDHAGVMARHHEDARHAFKRFDKRRPIGQLGNDRPGVLTQNLSGFIGVAYDANRRVAELPELLHNRPARIAGRSNNGNHGVLPC